MTGVRGTEYLELLARDASAVEFEAPLLVARSAGAEAETLERLEHAKTLALQVRAVLESRRRRATELTALFETASDLASLTDVDGVLEAIVRRSRQLLGSDVAYLSLNDDEAGDTYMRVTVGISSELFRKVRLPLGAGLGGLVAQTARPYSSATYFQDAQFHHTEGIDSAVHDEGITSIVGVPLLLGSRVIGVLYAANRTVRPFGRSEIALLSSFAAHAAIALDNARLLSETQLALEDLRTAGEELRARTTSVERATDAHDRLLELVLRGGDVQDVAREVGEVLGGAVVMTEPDGSLPPEDDAGARAGEREAVALAFSTSRTRTGDGVVVAPVLAGGETLGALVLRRPEPLDEADRRILERAALVTALLLLFRRSVATAEERLRGELLDDVLIGRDPDGQRERARLAGGDLDAPHAVVVCDLVGDRARTAQAAAFLAGGRHGLSTIHDGRIVVVLPDLDPEGAGRSVAAELSRLAGRPVTAGVAGPSSGAAGIAAACTEAARCLHTLLVLGRTGEVAGAADLGFVGLLLGEDRDVPAYVASVLGPVLGYDTQRGTALVETLRTYFDQGGNLGRTGAALHVHANTVTQRLERITSLLGEGWSGPEGRLEVQLALRLHALLGR